MALGGSAVVDLSTHDPKIKGSIPASIETNKIPCFKNVSHQGTLTEGESSVQLTSLYYFTSVAFDNEEVNRTESFPLS